MTLKERFLPKMYCFFGSGMLTNTYDEKVAESNAKECEKIADEFAIEFLDFAKNETDYDAWDSKFDYKGALYNSKKLLEIYKKENGL